MENWKNPAAPPECFICTKTIPPQQLEAESVPKNQKAFHNVKFLGNILDFPKLGEKFDTTSMESDDISYCKPCSDDLKMLQVMLQDLENLEKQVLDRKYEIELRMKENYENTSGNPIAQFRSRVSEELNKSSMLSMVEKIKNKQIGHKTRPEIPESRFKREIMEIGNGSTTIEPAEISESDDSNDSFENEPEPIPRFHTNSERLPNPISQNYSQEDIADPLSWESGDADIEVYEEEEEEEESGEILMGEQDEEIQDNGSGISIPDFLIGELVAPQIQSISEPPEVEESTKVIFTARNARVSHTVQQTKSSFSANANTGNSSRTRTSYICGTCGLNFPNYNLLTEHDKLHTGVSPSASARALPLESNLRKRLQISQTKILPSHGPSTRASTANLMIQSNRNGPSQNQKKVSASFDSKPRILRPPALPVPVTTTGNSSPTSEGEIRCGICSIECVSRSRLKLHMASHSEVRNFKCPLCQKKFKHKDALKAHIKTHSAVKSFVCSFCSGRFKYAKNLRAHIRYTHTHSSLNY